MADYVTPETIRAIAQQFYGYSLSAKDAERVAAMAGALAGSASALDAIGIEGVEAPFDYQALLSDADRLRKRR